MIAQSPKPELRLLAYQILIPQTRNSAERDRHLARAAAIVSKRLSREPDTIDLVVLPELSSIEYSREAFEALGVLAEPIDGPSFTTWRAVAKRFGVSIAYGLPVFTNGLLQITQVVVGPDGERRGAYAKLHTAQFGASMEKEFFSSGDHIFVFDVGGFRVAPIICYDIRIPELSRTLCLDYGVDLLIHSGAYSRDLSYYSWRHFVITRALENQVYVLSLNRAGQDFGGSIFCAPWIDQSQPPHYFGDGEAIETLTVTRSAIAAARRTYPFLSDRLADYSNLPLQVG